MFVALVGFVAAAWVLGRIMFAETPIDPKGIEFFVNASKQFGALCRRQSCDPRDNRFDGSTLSLPTRSPNELFSIAKSLLKGPIGRGVVRRSVDDAYDPILGLLTSTCCIIPADGSQIKILYSPSQFFQELTARIRQAQHQIVISALYVGDGPLSNEFMKSLEDKVMEKGEEARRAFGDRPLGTPCPSHEDMCGMDNGQFGAEVLSSLASETGRFSVDLLLDYNRMHDRRNMVTVKRLVELGSLYKKFVDVRVHLFQTPSSLNKVLSPFGRSKELLGVQHTKIFAFDESDVIMTGANLSDDYFKNRMDRYMVVQNTPMLAEWCAELVHTLASLSHRVVFASEDAIPDEVRGIAEVFPNLGNTPQKKPMARPPSGASLQETPPVSPSKRSPTFHKKSQLIILPNSAVVDPTHEQKEFREVARARCLDFASRMYKRSMDNLLYLDSRLGASERTLVNTLLFPTLQFGRVQIHHDVNVVEKLLHLIPESMHVYLTSPYLNMFPKFVDAVLLSKSPYDFVTASVTSNGWNGQKGFAGQIPYYYLQVERAFYFLMASFGCSERVRVREFTEPGMTFHSKGLWVTAPTSSGSPRDVLGDPVLAAYGSTNYGNRSVYKDVEAEMFVLTADCGLMDQMKLELQRLLQQSEEVGRERFVGARDGRFQPVVSLIALLGQDFM